MAEKPEKAAKSENVTFFARYAGYTTYVGKTKVDFHQNLHTTNDPAVIEHFRANKDQNVTEKPASVKPEQK